MTAATPRERWGTCCPFDPRCEHSYLDDAALARHMDTPFVDADDPEDVDEDDIWCAGDPALPESRKP